VAGPDSSRSAETDRPTEVVAAEVVVRKTDEIAPRTSCIRCTVTGTSTSMGLEFGDRSCGTRRWVIIGLSLCPVASRCQGTKIVRLGTPARWSA